MKHISPTYLTGSFSKSRCVVLATPVVVHRPTPAGAVAIGVLLALAVVSTSLYLAFSDYPPFFQDWHDTQFEVVATYQRERIHRPVSVVRLWR